MFNGKTILLCCQALNIKSDKGVMLERARCYFETGELEIASQQLEEILSEDVYYNNNYKVLTLNYLTNSINVLYRLFF